jgi:hypothetical protein
MLRFRHWLDATFSAGSPWRGKLGFVFGGLEAASGTLGKGHGIGVEAWEGGGRILAWIYSGAKGCRLGTQHQQMLISGHLDVSGRRS